MKSWHDLETYSPLNLLKVGAHAYAEKAEIMLWAYALEDGPVKVWDRTLDKKMPDDLCTIMSGESELWWHNGGMFDRVVISHDLNYFYRDIDPTRWRDTMVQALCHGLPGKLDTLCEIFKLGDDQAKDKRGKQLIQRFCKPQVTNSKIARYTRENSPEEWEEFKDYAKSDIRAMRALHKKMPKWNYPDNKFELGLWHLDQKINMRGVCVDIEDRKSVV